MREKITEHHKKKYFVLVAHFIFNSSNKEGPSVDNSTNACDPVSPSEHYWL